MVDPTLFLPNKNCPNNSSLEGLKPHSTPQAGAIYDLVCDGEGGHLAYVTSSLCAGRVVTKQNKQAFGPRTICIGCIWVLVVLGSSRILLCRRAQFFFERQLKQLKRGKKCEKVENFEIHRKVKMQKIAQRIILVWAAACLVAIEADDFYSLDHTFVFSSVRDCKNNEYYDVNYFNCKRCETSFNLVPSKDSK